MPSWIFSNSKHVDMLFDIFFWSQQRSKNIEWLAAGGCPKKPPLIAGCQTAPSWGNAALGKPASEEGRQSIRCMLSGLEGDKMCPEEKDVIWCYHNPNQWCSHSHSRQRSKYIKVIMTLRRKKLILWRNGWKSLNSLETLQPRGLWISQPPAQKNMALDSW